MPIGYKPNPADNVPNQSSTYGEWIEWHKQLRSRYGLKEANALFIKAYAKRKSQSLFDDLNVLNRKEFIDYFQSVGVKIDSSAADELVGFTAGIFDSIGDTLKFGKNIAMILSILLVVLIGGIIWAIIKNPAPYASTATAVATRGAVR